MGFMFLHSISSDSHPFVVLALGTLIGVVLRDHVPHGASVGSAYNSH